MKKFAAILLLLVILGLTSCHEPIETENIRDLNLYINEDYAKPFEENGESIWWKKEAGLCAKEFFPKYDEIEYSYSSIDFYVYAYNNHNQFLDVAFVLELTFDNAEEYEETKNNVYSSYSFLEKRVRDDDGIGYAMPAPEFQSKNFLVKIITEGEEKDDYPKRICAIGLNDEKYILRYIFLYDSNTSDVSEELFKNRLTSTCNHNW